jgi:hypothetical protein
VVADNVETLFGEKVLREVLSQLVAGDDMWRLYQFPGKWQGVLGRPSRKQGHAKNTEDGKQRLSIVIRVEHGLASEELGHDAAERPHVGVDVFAGKQLLEVEGCAGAAEARLDNVAVRS